MIGASLAATARQRLMRTFKAWLLPARISNPIDEYVRGGRIPWSPGYSKYKNLLLQKAMSDHSLLQKFANGTVLPPEYGVGIDERIVEMPWAISRIGPGRGKILDAGSVLNTPLVVDLPQMRERTLFVWSLEFDWQRLATNISYVHGDFRDSPFRGSLFETIVCISTLEHVGMWPIPKPPFAQSLAKPQPERDFHAYRGVLQEFRRLLMPGGQLLLTVPIGIREDHGWTQIFDEGGIADIKRSFGEACRFEAYYRYRPDGWISADAQACRDARYFNIVRTPAIEADGAAAARAVACLEFERLD